MPRHPRLLSADKLARRAVTQGRADPRTWTVRKRTFLLSSRPRRAPRFGG